MLTPRVGAASGSQWGKDYKGVAMQHQLRETQVRKQIQVDWNFFTMMYLR